MLSRMGYAFATVLVAALALACLAWSLLVPPPYPMPRQGVVVIKDVTLINPGLGRAQHVDITVREGVIAVIAPTSKVISRDDLHCAGCFALPGLIDMDARGPRRSGLGADRAGALDALRGGVTLVRDLHSTGDGVRRLRDRIDEGRAPGPRILSCGGMISGGPASLVRDEARGALALGARCLLAGPTLDGPAMTALGQEAARAHVPVVAATAGLDAETAAPLITDALGLELPAHCETSGAQTTEIVYAVAGPHPARTPLLADDPSGPIKRGACETALRSRMVRALFRSGAPIYAASGDSLKTSGAAVRRELAAFQALGLTPDQALVTATTSPGRFWPDVTYGQVAIGLPADLVLYRRDPTETLSALDTLDTVIADGRVYPKAEMDAWAARCRKHFDGWFYRWFTQVSGVAD